MKIYREKPKHDNSQPGHRFRRECHAFFLRHYEGDKKEERPEEDVVGDSHGQDFF